jgi:formylglycine-generating enzyme required for sulfatase activity
MRTINKYFIFLLILLFGYALPLMEACKAPVPKKGNEMVEVKGGQLMANGSFYNIHDFYIGKYEVTQQFWREIMGDDNVLKRIEHRCDNCPVTNVSWNEAQQFIKKLNEKTGKHYRLPTVNEWLFASMGGKKSKGHISFSGSESIDSVAWYKNNSDGHVHEVGTKKPNELGVYDMTGNVQEWCNDWCIGCGSMSGKVFKTTKGGSWGANKESCKLTSKGWQFPDVVMNNQLGFRLAMSK